MHGPMVVMDELEQMNAIAQSIAAAAEIELDEAFERIRKIKADPVLREVYDKVVTEFGPATTVTNVTLNDQGQTEVAIMPSRSGTVKKTEEQIRAAAIGIQQMRNEAFRYTAAAAIGKPKSSLGNGLVPWQTTRVPAKPAPPEKTPCSSPPLSWLGFSSWWPE